MREMVRLFTHHTAQLLEDIQKNMMNKSPLNRLLSNDVAPGMAVMTVCNAEEIRT